jgi:hypothetical protein
MPLRPRHEPGNMPRCGDRCGVASRVLGTATVVTELQSFNLRPFTMMDNILTSKLLPSRVGSHPGARREHSHPSTSSSEGDTIPLASAPPCKDPHLLPSRQRLLLLLSFATGAPDQGASSRFLGFIDRALQPLPAGLSVGKHLHTAGLFSRASE